MTYILLIIGLAAGVLSGVFGLGGGIIIVPALVNILKMPTQQAIGTSLAALVVPIGAAIGAVNYYKAGHLRVRDALLIAFGMAFGAFLGSWISTQIDASVLRKAFAVLMAIMAVRMWVM